MIAVRSADGIVYAFRDETSEHRLERAKSDFVATVSHELRTPLASIYGAAVTLLREDIEVAPDHRRQLLDIVAREAERLGRIVDEILLTAQLEAGRILLSEDAVDLRRGRGGGCGGRRAARSTHRAEAPTAVPAVLADDQKLRQVLMNLLDNAIKYSPATHASPSSVAEEGGRVVARVSDQGAGIPPAERGRIFEKFYRLDPDSARAWRARGSASTSPASWSSAWAASSRSRRRRVGAPCSWSRCRPRVGRRVANAPGGTRAAPRARRPRPRNPRRP